MDLADIVSTTCECLNQEFFQSHFLCDQLANGIDRCIDRPIAGSRSHTAFTINNQANRCHRDGMLAANTLEIIQLDSSGICHGSGSGEIAQVIVGDRFLRIGEDKELAVSDIQLGMREFISEATKMMIQRSATTARRQDNRRITDADIDRINDFIVFPILKHTILMNT